MAENAVERGGFFWFDPFGEAPADAEVSGQAGGPIAWGGVPSWPFERAESPLGFGPLLSGFAFRQRRPRYEPHFRFFTDVNPETVPKPEFTEIKWERRYIALTDTR